MNEESIFVNAIKHQTSHERATFLDGACAGNEELRARVEALIRSHEQGGSFLHEPAAPASPTLEQPTSERAGGHIGPYKLLQEIGHGGMGVVYMADQTSPVERRVALKLVKPGMDSHQIVARFEAERQALALMDHPNIAKVLDAATTESGHPYFVMELVNGVPITEYCDEQHLTLTERLELFLPVCHAVQHAHQKGIIHRDLKPSNILVALYDHQAVPKVIDFGVAKAMSQKLTEKTLFTQFGEIVGTLEYMSPEQARRNQLDVDTRSDVYALGVILYELLTGTTPFDKQRLRTAAFDEILRIFREEEPPRPSTRLTSIDTLSAVASNRRVDPQRLTTMVRGELDWIVMRALEKDRVRRYETVNGFASDIQRYLHDEPVVACPPSARYRFHKFAKRNKMVLATAAIIATAVLVGLIGTTSQWWRAELALTNEATQKRIAQTEAQRADVERDRAIVAEVFATRERDEKSRLLYASDMIAAQLAWETANLRHVTQLLDRYPSPDVGQEDLRGFAWYYLWQLCQRGLHAPTLKGHQGYIWCLEFSQDGKTLVTASDDGTAKLWDVESQSERLTLSGHTWGVLSVSFSADGKTIASGSADGMVRLWDAVTGEMRHEHVIEKRQPVTSVAISSSGKLLAGCLDGTVRLCDLFASPLQTIWGTPGGPRVWSVAFAPGSNQLAVGTEDGTVMLGNVTTPSAWTALSGHTSWARSVTFSADGRYLASASHDHTVKLWDATTGQEKFSFPHRDRAWSVAFSPDGKTLASAGNAVKLWNLDTGRELDTLIGHKQPIYTVAFSNDGNTLASGSHDTTVKLWDLTESTVRSILTNHSGSVWDVAVSNDSTTIASGGEDGSLRLWDGATGNELKAFEAHPNWVSCVAFSSDETTLASAGDDGSIKLWNVVTGEDFRLDGHQMPVFDLAFSPNGAILASASNDAVVKLWDTATGKLLDTLDDHSTIVWAVTFSPDGKLLATASGDKTVKLWDLEAGGEPTTLVDHTSVVNSVAFSPDGKYLASGSADGTVNLWEMATNDVLTTFTGHSSSILSVAFSPDGKTLASGSKDTTIKLWDLDSWRERETLIGHSSEVTSIAFTHDGNALISGSRDRTVRVWRRAIADEVQPAAP